MLTLKVKLFVRQSCSDLGAVAAHRNSSKWKSQIKISPFLDEVCLRYPLSSSHIFLEPFVIPLDCSSSWEAGLASICSRCPVSLHRPFVIWDWKSAERSDSARYEENLLMQQMCMHYWTHTGNNWWRFQWMQTVNSFKDELASEWNQVKGADIKWFWCTSRR